MSYTINQQNHFSKLINVAFKDINIQQLNTIYYKQLAKKLVKMLQDLPDTVNLDSPFAVAQNQSKIDALFTEINAMMRLRFRSQLSGIWNKAFDLGLKHQVEDILYSNKSIKKLWDKEFKSKKIDSVFSSKTDLVAFFGQKEEIERAEKEYAKLADSLEKVAKTGKYDNLLDDADVLGRYTPLERAYFLDSLIEISNIKRRAEASKYSYVSDQYMRNRLRVLSQDFADKYDNNTKKAVEKFLLKDVRYVRSIQTNNLIARNAIDSVADDLEKQALEVVNQNGGKKLRKLSYENKQPLYARAKAILRTETSIAYNMGKLIGYSSEEDINKKFRWVADWELQDTKEGYVVCDACRYMHNEVFTAKTLLAAAMRADTGIINYKGTRRSKTDFKNPSIPVIPFHPNCLVSAKVLMHDKLYKEIQDVQVNDKVYVPSQNNYRKVLETHKNWHTGQVYTVTTVKGQELVITGNHPVYTQRGWINVEDLAPATDVLYMGRLDTENVPKQNSIYKKFRDLLKEGLRLPFVKSNNNTSLKGFEATQNKKRNTSGEKSKYQFTSTQQSANDSKQCITKTRSGSENSRHESFTSCSICTLPLSSTREESLQHRIKGGFGYVLQEFLGSQYSKAIKLLQSTMDLRASTPTIEWSLFQTRLLSSIVRYLYRSKRLLDRGCANQIQTVYSMLPKLDNDTNRQTSVSEPKIDLSKLSSVGIASITSKDYSGYVYNLSIEGDEMYIANDILVHNCSCRFVRVFEPEEDSVGKQQVAVPVNSRGLLRQTQSLNIADTILPKVIGATLLVGGAFMLSRSNTWKKAFTIAQQTKLPAITKTEAVIDAVTYVEEVIGGPAADLTKEVLKDGVKKATASVS